MIGKYLWFALVVVGARGEGGQGGRQSFTKLAITVLGSLNILLMAIRKK